MLVKCDKCGQEYEVNEERIAPQGVRIKCPSCAHIFLVRRPDATTLSGLIGLGEMGASDEEVTWRVRHIGLTYTFHDLDSLRDWLSGRNSLQDVKIARGEDDWRELGDYPEVMTTELITRFFPLGDVPTTRSAEEEDISAVRSTDMDLGSDFMSLADLGSPATTGIAMAAPASVSANLSKAEKSASMKGAKRKKQQKAAAASADAGKRVARKKLIVVFILFTILAINIVLVTRFMKYGSIFVPDIPEYYDEDDDLIDPTKLEMYANGEGDADAANPEVQPEEPKVPELTPEEKARIEAEQIQKEVEEEKRRQLDDASQMVKSRKWPEARAILEAYRKQWPDDIEALQLLSKTYRGLSLGDRAAECDAEVKKLKAKAKAEAEAKDDAKGKEGDKAEDQKANKK